MAIREPLPADVNPEPDAKCSRSMVDAFPSDAHLSAAPQRVPIPNRPTPWLIAAVLVLICLTLSGCGGAEAQERSASASELRRAAAGMWLCPGMTAVWLDDSTVQCLNHLP